MLQVDVHSCSEGMLAATQSKLKPTVCTWPPLMPMKCLLTAASTPRAHQAVRCQSGALPLVSVQGDLFTPTEQLWLDVLPLVFNCLAFAKLPQDVLTQNSSC